MWFTQAATRCARRDFGLRSSPLSSLFCVLRVGAVFKFRFLSGSGGMRLIVAQLLSVFAIHLLHNFVLEELAPCRTSGF